MIPAVGPPAARKTRPKSAASTAVIVTTSARRIRHSPGEGRSQGGPSDMIMVKRYGARCRRRAAIVPELRRAGAAGAGRGPADRALVPRSARSV